MRNNPEQHCKKTKSYKIFFLQIAKFKFEEIVRKVAANDQPPIRELLIKFVKLVLSVG